MAWEHLDDSVKARLTALDDKSNKEPAKVSKKRKLINSIITRDNFKAKDVLEKIRPQNLHLHKQVGISEIVLIFGKPIT